MWAVRQSVSVWKIAMPSSNPVVADQRAAPADTMFCPIAAELSRLARYAVAMIVAIIKLTITSSMATPRLLGL